MKKRHNLVSTLSLQQFRYDGHLFTYELQFAQRKTIAISVHADTSILVKAPRNMPRHEIEALLRKRAQWIMRKQQYFATLPLRKAKSYVSGENHYFLGQTYPLYIVPQQRGGVVLNAGRINVYSVDSSSASVRNKLNSWYRHQAKMIFVQRLDICYQRAWSVLKLTQIPKLQIRRMKRRWGSCSRQGDIMLNTHLVKAPENCIDYVIIHELCHLREFNHSKAFYTLIGRILPDWKQRKKQLESLDVLDS